MKHYDYVEWLLYKNNLISLEKKIEMEEHLYNCDDCLEIFLSIIDEDEIENAKEYVPEDFTNNVLKKISKNKVKKIQPKNNKRSYIQFGYYVAVASVTIFLTMGGFFTNLVDAVPKVSVSIESNKEIEKPNIIYNFSERIVNSTSKFIGSIENIEEREIRRNNNER